MIRKRLLSLAIGSALALTAGVAAAQTPPPPPPTYGAPITLEQAKKVMAGAEAEAKKGNWSMAIIILDSGGNMVMMQRIDGTQLGSVDVARDKAWSAVAYRRSTKAFEDAIAQGGANLRLLRLTGANPIEGGLPIMADGKVIGSIGVSGGSSAQDGQVAKAGVDGLK
jgi:glc operon protein GlcG